MKKIINKSYSFYFCHMSQFISKSVVLHSILFILESIITLSQFLEIYNNEYQKNNNKLKINKISIPLKVLKILNIKKEKNIFIIFIPLTVILDILYFFYDIIIPQNKLLSSLIINFYEVLYFRFLFIFYTTIIFSVNEFYFFISILVIFVHLVITVYNFQIHHLYYFSPTFISLPYDYLSSTIDIINSFIKVFISLSLNSGNIISKYFYFLSFIFYFISSAYFILVMINNSYYLMNNKFLSKIRLSMNFGIFITLIFMYFNGPHRVLSISFLYVIFYVFIVIFIGNLVYNPFNFINIQKNNHDSNAIYYLFSNFSELQNKIKFQQAMIYHRQNCGICEMCLSFKDNKLLKNKDDENNESQNRYFSIIYNGHNKYFNLLLFIMKNYKETKLKFLSKNPHIILNILYLHYTYFINNNNLRLNLEVLFFVLNEKNVSQIEEQQILVKQLVLMNDFICNSKKTISQIKKIINCSFSDSPSQFDDMIKLSLLLNNLDSKNFRKNLFNKKSNIHNGNDSFYSLVICSIFYEELLNIHIPHNLIQIRENFSQYEEIITYLFHNNNHITLLFDVENFDVKIIRVGKNLISYLNSSLFDIFPKNFEDYQREEIKDILLTYLKKTNTSNSSIYNIPEMKFIIIEKDNIQLYYKLLNLQISLLFQKEMSDNMVLNGQYSIEQNIIITKIQKNLKKKEIIIGFGNKKYIYPHKLNKQRLTLMQFLSDNNLTKENLCLIYSIVNNDNKYNIYKNKTGKKKEEIEYFSEELKGSYDQSLLEKYKRDEVASVASTTSIDSLANNHYKKNSIDSNNLSTTLDLFKIFQIIEIVLLFLLIILTTIDFVHQNKLKNKFNNEYSMMGDFRLFYRKLYHLISSFLNVMCIAISPKNKECRNFMHEYTIRYNNIHFEHQINFTKILEEENYILASGFGNTLYDLHFSFSELDNKKINYILNSNFTFRQIVPNYSNKTLSVVNVNFSFSEALELIVNSFIIINSKYNQYMYVPFYIINYETNIFEHINFEVGVNEVQIEIYQLLLNFFNYEKTLKEMRYILDDYYDSQLKFFKFISIIYQIIILINKFSIIFIIYFYMKKFKDVLLMVLNSIRIKLKRGEDDYSKFKENFENKIENLEILIEMYSENPVIILSKLEDTYHNYKKDFREYLKNRNNNNNKNEELEDKYQNLLKQYQQKYIFSMKTLKKSGFENKYIFFRILMIIGTTIIFIIEFYLIFKSFNNSILVIKLIKNSASTESSGYKNMIFFQLMLYLNQTEEEISYQAEYLSIDSKIQEKFIDIFVTEKKQKEVSNILLFLSNIVSISCEDFFYLANDERLNKINEKYPNEKIYSNLSYYCSTTEAMKVHKSEIVFQNLFGLINDGIKSIRNKSYSGIINFLEKDYLYKCALFNFFIYRPLRSIVNFQVIKLGTNNIIKLFDRLFYINIIIDVTSQLCVLSIIIFIFIIGVEKTYKKIIRLKNVFSICNY